MTKRGDEDIEGGSESFYTHERGALKKLFGQEGGSENLFTSKPTGGGEGLLTIKPPARGDAKF